MKAVSPERGWTSEEEFMHAQCTLALKKSMSIGNEELLETMWKLMVSVEA